MRRTLGAKHSIEEIEFTRVREELESLISSVYNYYTYSAADRPGFLRRLYAESSVSFKDDTQEPSRTPNPAGEQEQRRQAANQTRHRTRQPVEGDEAFDAGSSGSHEQRKT